MEEMTLFRKTFYRKKKSAPRRSWVKGWSRGGRLALIYDNMFDMVRDKLEFSAGDRLHYAHHNIQFITTSSEDDFIILSTFVWGHVDPVSAVSVIAGRHGERAILQIQDDFRTCERLSLLNSCILGLLAKNNISE